MRKGRLGIKPFQTSKTLRRRRTQSIYDQLGSTYDELYREEQREKHDIILRETNLHRSDVCLDLGCGTGDLTRRLTRRCRFVVGIDFSRRMILAAKKQDDIGSRCALVLGDGEHLPFHQDSFQGIFAITVILDPESVSRIIVQAKRILSNGGLAVFTSVTKAAEFDHTESVMEHDLHGWEVRKIQIGPDIGWFVRRTG